MGRVLVHLVVLSTASAWKLSSGGEEAHDSTLSPHESAIPGGVENARDRRRELWLFFASSCDGWSVSLPACPALYPLLTVPRCPLTRSDHSTCAVGASCDNQCNGCDGSCDHSCDFGGTFMTQFSCDAECDDLCDRSCDTGCDSCTRYSYSSCDFGCDTGCSACPSGKYSAASTSLVARAPWPSRQTAQHKGASCRRTRNTHRLRTTTRHHTPTNGVRSQARERTFAILAVPSRRPRARRARSARVITATRSPRAPRPPTGYVRSNHLDRRCRHHRRRYHRRHRVHHSRRPRRRRRQTGRRRRRRRHRSRPLPLTSAAPQAPAGRMATTRNMPSLKLMVRRCLRTPAPRPVSVGRGPTSTPRRAVGPRVTYSRSPTTAPCVQPLGRASAAWPSTTTCTAPTWASSA